jgi:L-fuconolactonase
MPTMIVDSHIHIIDHAALPYGWVDPLPAALRASRDPAEYRAAVARTGVARAVVIEFLVDDGHHLDEAAFIQGLAGSDPLIAAFVANAPVEHGEPVSADLERLSARPAVRAIRRVVRDGKFDRVLSANFVAGVQTVGSFGLPFELAVDHSGLPHTLELARRCPDVTFVLDHLGTPPITARPAAPWTEHMRAFAGLPNVVAKLSGLMAGVDPQGWDERDVVAHLKFAIDCFGPDRVMYGSDWPMFTPILAYADWLGIVQAATSPLSPAECERVYVGVASDIYRLPGAG